MKDRFSRALAAGVVTLAIGIGLLEIGTRMGVIIGAAFLASVAGWHGLKSLHAGSINVGAVLSSQTILWYAAPLSYAGFIDYDALIQVPFRQNAISLGLISVSATACFIISQMKGITLRLPLIEPRYIYAAAVISFVQLSLIVGGNWGFATMAADSAGRGQNYLTNTLNVFAPAAAPICAALLGRLYAGDIRRSSGLTLAAITILVIQIVWWTASGRRNMSIVFVMTMVFAFRYAFPERVTGKTIATFAALGLLAIPANIVAWDYFWTTRLLAENNDGSPNNLSILEYQEIKQRAAAYDGGVGGATDNMIIRPFALINTFSDVTSETQDFLWGRNILTYTLLAIPPIFFASKADTVGESAEDLWRHVAWIEATDWSNTIFMDSYMDFGLAGFPIYIAIILMMATALIYLANLIKSPLCVMFIFFSLAFGIFNIEILANTLLVIGRGLFVLIVATAVLRWIISPSGAHMHARPSNMMSRIQ
ncbi:hypothetical protein [Rhizorhabdus sp.]|uniref:hypothetical protein n=1 Tax=Rhizorhabdus sp. TaxID=1968843 RepID=UPI00198A4969|nr:hypothetical protein [Rhizorhabdus sp.]MBD3760738.1 hypothetical protein [Rhizorhabdus sp.]